MVKLSTFKYSEHRVKLFFTCWLIYKNHLEEAALLARYQWGLDIHFFEILKNGYHFIYTFFVLKDTANLNSLDLNKHEFSRLRLSDHVQYATAKEIRDKFNSYFSNLKPRLIKKLALIYRTPQNELIATTELKGRIQNLYGIFISELLLAGYGDLVSTFPEIDF